jgi:pilus assembly protein CpaB
VHPEGKKTVKTRLIGGIAALLLVIIGSFMLINYVSGADRRAQAALDPTDVLIVKQSVPAGTKAEDMGAYVDLKSVPGGTRAADAVADLTEVAGKVTSVALEPGEQVLSARLVDPTQLITPGAVSVPDGLQEVTVLLPPEAVVGGSLRAGDLVGVYVSMAGANPAAPEEVATQLLFDQVLVTSIQQAPPADTATPAEGTSAVPGGSAFVTFARNSVDATKIIHSAGNGSIWLTKQSATTPASARSLVSTSQVFK